MRRVAVSDDCEPLEAEQIAAPVRVGVEPTAQAAERRTDHEAAERPSSRGDDLLAQRLEHGPDRALEHLQRHVAREAVADDDLGRALEQQAPLDVPDKADPVRGKQLVGLADEPVALLRLLADREQTDLRVGEVQDLLGEDRPHVRELEQVLGTRVGVRAGVDQDRRPASRRDRRGDGGPGDLGQAADLEQAGCEHGAGVPRRHDDVGLAVADSPAGCEQRAVALLTRRVCGLLVHADDLRRVHDLEVRRQRLDDLHRPEQNRLDVVDLRRPRARDDLVRRPVAAHGVHSDSDGHAVLGRDLLALREHYGAGVSSGSTSRPRYVPHVGQTWCGRLGW